MSPSIYIETAGCAFNVSDSEAMAGELVRAGHRLVHDAESADLIILNTCTVKDKTHRDFQARLAELRRGGGGGSPTAFGGAPKPVIVAGCVPKAHERISPIRDVSTLGPDALGRVAEVVAETLNGRFVTALDGDRTAPRPPEIVRRNPIIEILPIARGCLSACSFCQTRLARGRLSSFRPAELIDRARRALDEGAREIWVTGQDTGAYGRDIGSSLPDLLAELADLPGDFRIRLGMSSPQWIHERLSDLLDVYLSPRMFQFLHVPIQSGSPAVLEHMRRDGTVDQFREIHAAFHDKYPEMNFVTDLIVGYPTETDADHRLTMELIESLGLGFANVSKFSPRPGTTAARLPALPRGAAAGRAREVMEALRANAGTYLEARVGRAEWVMVDEAAPPTNGRPAGPRVLAKARTAAYRPVFLEGAHAPGETFMARITGAKPFHFYGARESPEMSTAASAASAESARPVESIS